MYYVYINENKNGSFDIGVHEGMNGIAKGVCAIFEFENILAAKRHVKMLKTYDKEMLKKIADKQRGEGKPNKKRDCLKRKPAEEGKILDDILGR